MDIASEAVENLVTQFSSALDFYRELVQNSIDAGSSSVEIWLDFLPNESGAGGVIEIHVDDAGEGMNEAVIDEQLTTLFSSTKEHDLTKIGKFGIGFVSVFALRPKGVLVQTGRGGEYWEVFFAEDRSFYKSRLDTPVEGTQITLFLEGDRARYTELVVKSVETIDHWCRHSEAEINFEDRASYGSELISINKPFSVAGECMSEVEYDGTLVVLAYSRTPVWGFYNKGLALAVVRGANDLVPPHLTHIAFRIQSRYLEHTLSRETVMRDENYERVMDMVTAAAHGALRGALIEAIAGLVRGAAEPAEGPRGGGGGGGGDGSGGDGARGRARRWSARERGRYFELMGYLALEGAQALEGQGGAPLFLGFDGRAYTLDQLCELAAADGRIYTQYEASALVEQLLEQGTPVIMTPSEDEIGAEEDTPLGPVTRVLANGLAREFISTGVMARMLQSLRGASEVGAWAQASEMITRPAKVLVGVEVVRSSPTATALVAAAESILARGLAPPPGLFARVLRSVRGEPRLGYGRLVCAELHSGAGLELPLFVVAHAIAPLMAAPTREQMVSERPERPQAAVNCEHPHFRALTRLAAQEPELAAYCLAKSLLLVENRGLEYDVELISAARDPGYDRSQRSR